MTLRETVHQSIDKLDSDALAVIYEQIKLLEVTAEDVKSPKRASTIEEVWGLTDSIPGCWSDDLAEEREERF